ncbi:Sir2 family NAD+-dependent deacetylase [Bdellovibrio svalbardensis]|uniref:NAD-dependent protein deacylase n=1 Tax=Bdellovibrio svalbardensis TaxID=2972972 RepID=A0ABT6DG62_9BACT|nr:Sir2 family NAD+-dependent deacetylase [Bdellovibrio svalbardensis]MDG0815835.1 NAD-dependent protein deacylase [Bdellovibrio svalbardensis]
MNPILFKNIVILTGAGISAESGIRTFRDQDGLWEEHRIEDVATPEAFARSPELVQRFYNARRAQLKDPKVQPNAAHLALAELEKHWEGDFLLITQNVDNLHRRAGSKNLLHMHGRLDRIRCLSCEEEFEWTEDLPVDEDCPHCGIRRALRPDIVWFGEMPYFMEEIYAALDKADLFISIGTSGNVYPAAGFVSLAWKARKIEINTRDTEISAAFAEHLVGAASIEVPKLIQLLLDEEN